ncbi:MAG: HepT-like ribonuclease domain-containing protein [Caulobacteraceae bacterium]
MSRSSENLGRAALAIVAARENIALIRTWAGAKPLAELRSNTLVRYAVERAFMAIHSALRDIPATVVPTSELPTRLIAGFRNALAHTYDDILDERVILTIREDLPALDREFVELLARLENQARE